MRQRLGRARAGGDAGFTIVELAVAMLIMGIVASALSTTMLSSRQTAETVRQVNNLNEEARLAVNRITRELRQAREVTAVGSPDPSKSVTFNVDFNGNGTIDTNAADPERLTYTYDTTTRRILLSAADTSGTTVTQPILSGEVSRFSLGFRSSRYQFDCNSNGVTTWQELDAGCPAASPVVPALGNNNGTLDAAELPYIDSVVLDFSVLDGARKQNYRTQIDLRNATS
jgi:prepilin-type N-terminal cleavage/methylation domain-containing protein